MTNGSMIVHRGARFVDRETVDLVPAPPATATYFPQRHSHVLQTVEETLHDAGYRITKSQYALSQCFNRFFGMLDLDTAISDGVSLVVAVRNSCDKTYPLGLSAGSRCFICDNGAISGDIYVSKKHTKFSQERFREGISKAIQSLSAYTQVEAARIASYRQTELSENEAAACLLHAFEDGILSPRTLPIAIQEWREPSFEEFEPRTAWSCFNALTYALGERKRNPAFVSPVGFPSTIKTVPATLGRLHERGSCLQVRDHRDIQFSSKAVRDYRGCLPFGRRNILRDGFQAEDRQDIQPAGLHESKRSLCDERNGRDAFRERNAAHPPRPRAPPLFRKVSRVILDAPQCFCGTLSGKDNTHSDHQTAPAF